MEIKIKFGILELDDKYIFINVFNAYKVEGFKKTLIKNKTEKHFLTSEEFVQKLTEIKKQFENHNTSYSSNIKNNILDSIFKEVLIDDSLNQELELMKNELKELEIIREVPSYVNSIPEGEFKINATLFLIALFFEKHPEEIFEFPLFLSMKKSGLIEDSLEVEEYVENLLEDVRSIV